MRLPFTPAFGQIAAAVLVVSGFWYLSEVRPLRADLSDVRQDLEDERTEHDNTKYALEVEQANATAALERSLNLLLANRDLSRRLDEARAEGEADIATITVEAQEDFQDADPVWSAGLVPDRTHVVRMRQQCAIWRTTTGTDHPNCRGEAGDDGSPGATTEALRTDTSPG